MGYEMSNSLNWKLIFTKSLKIFELASRWKWDNVVADSSFPDKNRLQLPTADPAKRRRNETNQRPQHAAEPLLGSMFHWTTKPSPLFTLQHVARLPDTIMCAAYSRCAKKQARTALPHPAAPHNTA
jgi:hypothetical protein